LLFMTLRPFVGGRPPREIAILMEPGSVIVRDGSR